MAYQRVTLDQLKARLAERLGGEQKFWNEPEREAAINEAVGVWQLLTGDVIQTDTQVLPPETNLLQLVLDKPVLTTLRVRCDPCSLSVVATANATSTFVGQDATFTATATSGVEPYSYVWAFGKPPTSHWTMDETSGARADSVGSTPLTSVNTVATAVGVQNTAANFTSASSQVLWADYDPNFTDVSVSVWAKIGTPSTYNAIFALTSWWPDWTTLAIYKSNSEIRALVGDGNGFEYTTQAWPGTGWHHYVATYNSATKKVSLYVDGGAATESDVLSGSLMQSSDSRIVVGGTWTNAFANFWDGDIDEVTLYPYLLTAADVATLYSESKVLISTATNPTWQFDAVGTKVVAVRVVDAADCVATASTTISIDIYPMSVTFTSSQDEPLIGDEQQVYFFPEVTDGVAPYSYYWVFDTVATSTEENPVIIFTRTDTSTVITYTVTVTATDDALGTATYSNTVDANFHA